MNNIRTSRPLVSLIAAVLVAIAAVSCGSVETESSNAQARPKGSDSDELVASALQEVVSEEVAFRSRATGPSPFDLGDADPATFVTIFEVNGNDVLEASTGTGISSASAVIGDTAYSWFGGDEDWDEQPVETWDPLIGPGFLFSLNMLTLFDLPPYGDSNGLNSSYEADVDPFPIVGWTEIDATDDDFREFEISFSLENHVGSELIDDEYGGPDPSQLLSNEMTRHTLLDALVALDSDGHLVRIEYVGTFNGSPDYPDCDPMNDRVGTTEQIIEFSNVDEDFQIALPTKEDLADISPEFVAPYEMGFDNFTNFAIDLDGADLTGCPKG